MKTANIDDTRTRFIRPSFDRRAVPTSAAQPFAALCARSFRCKLLTVGGAPGERIVLVTDRRIGFWEASNQPGSIDHPFTVIELRLNREGLGEARCSLATKAIYDKQHKTLTLELRHSAGPAHECEARR
jgi:hypothetical protein